MDRRLLRVKTFKIGDRSRDREGGKRHGRLYIGPHSETVWQNLVNRRCRPVDAYRQLLPEILRRAKLPPGTRATWSQTAGCGCGCSPGFLLHDTPITLHVSVVTNKHAKRAAAHRRDG